MAKNNEYEIFILLPVMLFYMLPFAILICKQMFKTGKAESINTMPLYCGREEFICRLEKEIPTKQSFWRIMGYSDAWYLKWIQYKKTFEISYAHKINMVISTNFMLCGTIEEDRIVYKFDGTVPVGYVRKYEEKRLEDKLRSICGA